MITHKYTGKLILEVPFFKKDILSFFSHNYFIIQLVSPREQTPSIREGKFSTLCICACLCIRACLRTNLLDRAGGEGER